MYRYDLNDPYDIDVMRADFDSISMEEWDRFIELAKEKRIGFDQVGCLMRAVKKVGNARRHSNKDAAWALAIVEELEKEEANEDRDEHTAELIQEKQFNIPKSHVTLRVAWHDNKWNGTICKDPESNTYCNGFNSLLSERIRKRKDDNIDAEIQNKGKAIKDIDYLPPCFWSVNLFGKDPMKARHDNPAAPTLIPLEEELPANSMYSWPFAVSFNRTNAEVAKDGAYPRNLEQVRIPRFTAKLKEDQSIAFMYAKFSNPLTEEEQQYLVVGAGIIDSRHKASEIPHFGPKEEIEKIRERAYNNQKNRNFPSMNWALQVRFNDYFTVRMPYHEYLEYAENLEDEDKDAVLDKIKVAITEPELVWCFKYVAMDIGDDEAIYILTKMRKSLLDSLNDGIVPVADMQERLDKVEHLLKTAWESRSYFPGFSNAARVFLNELKEPDFKLETFFENFKESSENQDADLKAILENPDGHPLSQKYSQYFNNLLDRLDQYRISIEEFMQLCLLNLKPFQFKRIVDGKMLLNTDWIRDFDEDIKRSHSTKKLIENPYLIYEDYNYWPDAHDDVFGDEEDSPIDLFKIDIAYFPDTRFKNRSPLQRKMSFVDKRRIRALVLRYLKTLENSGDCFATAEELEDAMKQYSLYYELGAEFVVPENIFYPVEAEYANHFSEEPAKLKLVTANDTTYYYLNNVYQAETNIESKFRELLDNPHDNADSYPELNHYIDISVDKLCERIGSDFDEDGFRLERQQLYDNIYKKRMFVISGSAGSGKSYEILNILTELEKNKNQKYLVLAPTGKAALRLSSDSDFPNITASTIDKFIAGVEYKKISSSEVKKYVNVVIDETSMVDLLKFEKLLNIFNFKEPSFKRLILIGDPNQLPAIGYGRVLADLITYLSQNPKYQGNFIQLETNCRSELKENAVLLLAEAFTQKGELDSWLGLKIESGTREISEGFNVRHWTNKEELYAQITEEFDKLSKNLGTQGSKAEKLNQILGLSEDGEIVDKHFDIENFQILTPYNSQFSGAARINDYIQTEFKKGIPYELRKGIFKKADKMIRTKNYYHENELLLSNGTIGIINEAKGESFHFEKERSVSSISFKDIRSSEKEFFELAYAVSVHKSQGSGFNHLFVVLPARYGLLSKELVYTALTRTKQTITLFIQKTEGNRKSVIHTALDRSFSAARRTSLMLDKPYRHYDLEPEEGVFVESRIELMIYHALIRKRAEMGGEFIFSYEQKPVMNGEEVPIRTDFTVEYNGKIWYWEHLGLLGHRKYVNTWLKVKKPTYERFGLWDQVITTDETNGINPYKIDEVINIIIENRVETDDQHNKLSNHHYYLR
jgi:exodeoxyribonuclease V alpha subunit